MNSLNISDRLKKVANCVKKDSFVADIGCDHAYTAIYLVKNKIAKKVIAMDINKGPLEKAKSNICNNRLEDYIETRLSDGGKELKKGEVNTILISGMGGRLTTKILDDSLDVVRECRQLVLQPQSEIYLVREYIAKIGFRIEYEDMFIDEGKYYVIINALKEDNTDNNSTNEFNDDNKTVNISSNIEKINNKVNNYKNNDENNIIATNSENAKSDNRKLFDLYGEFLLKNKNETLYEFLNNGLEKKEDILEKLLSNEKSAIKNSDRIKEIKKELQLIREGLKYYEL